MAGLKSLFGDTALYGLSSIVARLLNFALTPLLTMVLSKSEYGVNSLLYVSIAFLMVILTYGFETAYFRFSQKKGFEESRVYSTAMWSLIISTVVFLIVLLICYVPISQLLHLSDRPYLILWMGWIVAMDAVCAVPFARLRAQRKARRFIIIKISQIGINFLLCYVIFLFLPNVGYKLPEWKVGWVLFSNLIASAFMMILLAPEFFAIKKIFDFKIWKTMILFGFPLLLAGLPGIANEMADRFFIEYLMPISTSKEDVGTYSAIYKLSIFLILFNQAFRYAAEPYFFKKSENTKNQMAVVLRLFTGILCIGMVVVINAVKNKEFNPKKNLHSFHKELMGSDSRGVNTMSISEITGIPRPTVVRKLKYLIDKKFLHINKKKLITFHAKESAFITTNKMVDQNMLDLSNFIFRVFNQIKIINENKKKNNVEDFIPGYLR